jgi:peroxiredoxin
MARTSSTMLELGTPAPDFILPEPATSRVVSLVEFSGQPLVVAFICNHCPYVKHIISRFSDIARHYKKQGIAFIAINSNDVDHYPGDSPDKMVGFGREHGFTFPYLFDGAQSAAKAYRAACTPDLFLFDAAHRLIYRGQFDDSRPHNDVPVTGRDLTGAMDLLLAGNAIPVEQKPSLGCNIKWKTGNEPEYYS